MRAKTVVVLSVAFFVVGFAVGCGGGGGDGGGGQDWNDEPELNAYFPDPLEELTDKAKEAVGLAPNWLKYELIDNLRRFTDAKQDEYAELIINPAEERFRDEFAFLVAHISTGDISNPSFSPELLEENVATMYENDEFLDYVEILDISEKDGDYYSTTEYQMPDGGTLELPREYYYWFIAHPRIEDESPTYINPDTGGMADPPDGVFWRSYLFNHTDGDCNRNENCLNYSEEDEFPCPDTLKDKLQNALYMWEGHTTHNHDEYDENVDGTGALEVVVQWVNEVVHWGAHKIRRPIQPVRIYAIHCGHCGEYADISDAAARAALLPAINISALPNDHVWNEFYDMDYFAKADGWHEWEPVNWYINNFTSYDKDPDEGGWWPIYAAMGARGDGYAMNHTTFYSEHCTIKVTVKDSQGKPVDGAKVTLYGRRYGMFLPAIAKLTDKDGLAEIKVGEGNYTDPYPLRYYFDVKSELGNYPESGDPEPLVNMPDVGDVIETEVELSDAADWPPLDELEQEGGAGRYIARIDHELGPAIMYGTGAATAIEFSDLRDEGWLTLIIFDRENYEKYTDGEASNPEAIKKLIGDDTYDFDVPGPGCWYFLLLNDSVNATQVGNITFELLRDGEPVLDRTDEPYLKAGRSAIYELCGL